MTPQASLLHDLIALSATRHAQRPALGDGNAYLSYAALWQETLRFANSLMALGMARGERIGVYLEKRFETVIASFAPLPAAPYSSPVNPLLKAEQVAHILRDCNVRVLVTSGERLRLLSGQLEHCPDLQHVVRVGAPLPDAAARTAARTVTGWDELLAGSRPQAGHRVIDSDMAAIFYTSGSTGKPKGVVLSHRNLVAGALSVAGYLENSPDDILLAVLPLSFDAGFSQLTTAFASGAKVVLLNHLLPVDVLKAMAREQVTGLTAVPPLYIQLAQLDWPDEVTRHLRYFANTGGHMPQPTLATLRAKAPAALPYLMYGLTESFRSTYLSPQEAALRPGSIGKAIPNAEVLVLKPDGSLCGPNEPGELVHRGPLVSLGYWNDPETTAERFRPLPAPLPCCHGGLTLPEIAVFSGDLVRMDEEGFLYFIGRSDDMIKTSGYRVSPLEVEEVIHATGLVDECVAFGMPHPSLGQVIVVVVTPVAGTSVPLEALLAECRHRMPAYMVPKNIHVRANPLPRGPNGKIDRALLRQAASDSPLSDCHGAQGRAAQNKC